MFGWENWAIVHASRKKLVWSMRLAPKRSLLIATRELRFPSASFPQHTSPNSPEKNSKSLNWQHCATFMSLSRDCTLSNHTLDPDPRLFYLTSNFFDSLVGVAVVHVGLSCFSTCNIMLLFSFLPHYLLRPSATRLLLL